MLPPVQRELVNINVNTCWASLVVVNEEKPCGSHCSHTWLEKDLSENCTSVLLLERIRLCGFSVKTPLPLIPSLQELMSPNYMLWHECRLAVGVNALILSSLCFGWALLSVWIGDKPLEWPCLKSNLPIDRGVRFYIVSPKLWHGYFQLWTNTAGCSLANLLSKMASYPWRHQRGPAGNYKPLCWQEGNKKEKPREVQIRFGLLAFQLGKILNLNL